MDSGMMYRGLAFGVLKAGIQDTQEAVAAYLPHVRLDVSYSQSQMIILVEGKDVSSELLTSRVSEISSRISRFQCVRSFLFQLQREFGDRFGRHPGVIAVGRDMGTVIFPRADLKFFVTASIEVRARRRYEELCRSEATISYEQVLQAIRDRDFNDAKRKIAPLKRTSDMILVETDHLTPEGQAKRILDHIREQ